MPPIHFLLVDDLEENLLSLEALLRRDELVLLKARSGDEALELLLHNEVALALIDVQMPGLNGFELAELMRGNERTRRIPIIFVTAGSTDSQRRFRGYEAGAVDFIQKPIEPDILRSKVAVFFELYRQQQQITMQRDELQVQAEALQEADRRKDEFLAILAHELRNPLAPIRHGLDVLRKGSSDTGTSNILDMMDRQMVHLIRLIDDLLDVSRVSQGKIELRTEKIEVADVVRNAVEASQPLIDAQNHTLTVDLSAEPLWIDADLTRLSQVLGNLLNNAAKYTPSGGQIRLSTRPEGGAANIVISDNGVGIPAEMQSEVFDLFAQVEDHLDRSQGGLGIGLALVKRLVSMHGGTVSAKSEGAGKGSSFTVSIPLVDPPSFQPQALNATTPPASTAPLRILLVDDTIEVAEAIGWMLEAINHDYITIHDGRAAVASAIKYRPDVILLDIGLPGMDGYSVCKALREEELFHHTPIVAMTGWGQDQHKSAAAEAGFTHHLVKPVSLSDLETVLANLTLEKQ